MFEVDELVSAYEVSDRTAPWLRANFISSLDGAATVGGLSGGLNDEWDKQVFDVLRRLADVVVVGAGTARAEGYGALRLDDDAVAWRRAHGLEEQPAFALVSSALHLDPTDDLFTKAPRRPLVLTSRSASAERRAALTEVADVVDCGAESVEPEPLRATLVERGLPQMLCEGGPSLLGSLLDGDAVDELCLTIAPVLAGGDAPRIAAGAGEHARRLRRVHALPGGEMLFLRYVRT